MATKLNPTAARIIRGFAEVGAKALGAMFESVLEDVDEAAGRVSTTARRGRERIRNGVGRPKRRDHENE